MNDKKRYPSPSNEKELDGLAEESENDEGEDEEEIDEQQISVCENGYGTDKNEEFEDLEMLDEPLY